VEISRAGSSLRVGESEGGKDMKMRVLLPEKIIRPNLIILFSKNSSSVQSIVRLHPNRGGPGRRNQAELSLTQPLGPLDVRDLSPSTETNNPHYKQHKITSALNNKEPVFLSRPPRLNFHNKRDRPQTKPSVNAELIKHSRFNNRRSLTGLTVSL